MTRWSSLAPAARAGSARAHRSLPAWRRAGLGLCVVALLGVSAAGAPLAGIGSRPAPGTASTSPGAGGEVGDPWRNDFGQPPEDWDDHLDTGGDGGSSEPNYVSASYTENDIPDVALRAYRNAAELIGRTDPGCHLHWSLLAAIGRVESNHGRHGGAVIDQSGNAEPAIVGLVLDGSNDTARITDTDGGRLDGDSTFDRAVGPMQFLPGTWELTGVDGNGDGKADPNNIFDAAASAGRYLCAGDVDLSDPAQLRDAVLSYNHSSSYVDLVLRIAADYRDGIDPTGTPTVPADVEDPEPLDPPDGRLPPATSNDHQDRQVLNEPSERRQRYRDGHRNLRPGNPGQDDRHDDQQRDPGEDGRKNPSPGDRNGGGKNPPGGGKNEPAPPGDGGKPGPPNDGGKPGPGDDKGDGNNDGNGDEGPPEDGHEDPGDDQPVVPVVRDVKPRSGAVGETVTITGKSLKQATARFDEKRAEVVESESTVDTLVVKVPPHKNAGEVTLTVRTGGESDEASFTYLPAVELISPDEGSPTGGDEVTITGSSLKDAVVTIGGETADSENGETPGKELTVVTPPGELGEVDVVVRNGDQTATEEDGFTYRPTVTEVTPESPKLGGTVKLDGSGFSEESGILLVAARRDEEAIRVKEDFIEEGPDKGQLTFQVPEKIKPGEYFLVVTTNGVSSAGTDIKVEKKN